MRALILAAGLGTRLDLKKTPKCMVKIEGKPLLEHLVNRLNKAGVTEIMVNIHKDYSQILKYFGTRLIYFYEPVLLGEAATEKMISSWLGNNYLVINGDTLTNLDYQKLVEEGAGYYKTRFVKERYGGTTLINKGGFNEKSWDGDGAWYFDCGTPAKLRKARKFYAKR